MSSQLLVKQRRQGKRIKGFDKSAPGQFSLDTAVQNGRQPVGHALGPVEIRACDEIIAMIMACPDESNSSKDNA